MQSIVARSAGSAARTMSAATRGLHTTAPRNGGRYDYLHAKYMYNFRNKPASKLGAFVSIFGLVGVGVAIPIWSVHFNQKKAGLK